ncbi:MAG: bifunctional glutamate N-acetyltransferase/amino-acid acetyltransferase ArgJ [Planctomycetes bacterium]|nr:bifunctional glutamate N-acetyltransferase/amino-acid acetyltransferase ArgJ [Planctomycetota bacterium]
MSCRVHTGRDAAAPVAGFSIGTGTGGIRSSGHDVLVITAQDGAVPAAAVFTQNRLAAAPVQFSRKAIQGGRLAGVVANSGNANCATGDRGMDDAATMAGRVAGHLGDNSLPVLVASTGIIGRHLPMEKVARGIADALDNLGKADLYAAAEAIMTTDTVPKAAAAVFKADGKAIRVAGIAKGAGMIAPNMATMLSFILTDAAISADALKAALSAAVEATYNCVTVDGDTSTNDTLALMASGKAGNATIEPGSDGYAAFASCLHDVALSLARQIARDGEGATRLVEVRVHGSASDRDARLIAKAVAESPLVKTAIHGGDPNWGRIIAAAGRSGADFDPGAAELQVNGVLLFKHGAPAGNENAAAEAMSAAEILVDLNAGDGHGAATMYTCDLSKEYITINADYHT